MDYIISNLNTYGQFIFGCLFGCLFVTVNLVLEELFWFLRDLRVERSKNGKV